MHQLMSVRGSGPNEKLFNKVLTMIAEHSNNCKFIWVICNYPMGPSATKCATCSLTQLYSRQVFPGEIRKNNTFDFLRNMKIFIEITSTMSKAKLKNMDLSTDKRM